MLMTTNRLRHPCRRLRSGARQMGRGASRKAAWVGDFGGGSYIDYTAYGDTINTPPDWRPSTKRRARASASAKRERVALRTSWGTHR